MKRKLFITIASALLAVALTGCSPLGLDAQTLMKPPKATGERQEIYSVLEEKANHQLTLRYPKAGEYRSAIVMKDVTGDGNDEAIAFYTKGDEPYTIISVISQIDGTWTEIASYKNPSTQIDRICFGDFNGNGIVDFAIGWGNSTTGTSELNLYTYKDETIKEVPTKELYNELAVVEFESGKNGILTIRLQTKESPSTAKLFTISNGSISLLGTAKLDSDVTKYNKVTVGKISANDYGIILDGMKSARTYQTEILYWDRNDYKLKNPLYRPEDKTVLYTERNTSIPSQDINGDSMIEIPITHILPGISSDNISDTAYIVNWHRYDVSTNTFTNLLSTVVNSKDGYMFMIPDAWKDVITTEWSEENRALTFYEWIPDTAGADSGVKGSALLTIQVMTEDEWKNQSENTELYKLKRNENMVFAAKLESANSKLSLTMEQVEYYFRLFSPN